MVRHANFPRPHSEPPPPVFHTEPVSIVTDVSLGVLASDWMSGTAVYPSRVTIDTKRTRMFSSSVRRCECHPRSTWDTFRVVFPEYGTVLVAGVVDPVDGATMDYCTALPGPVAMENAVTLLSPVPDYMGKHAGRRSIAHANGLRLELMLHGLLATAYARHPEYFGGPHPLLARLTETWAFADRQAVVRTDGIDLLDPYTWFKF